MDTFTNGSRYLAGPVTMNERDYMRRRTAAFVLLAAGTGLVFETRLMRADEEENQPVTDQAEQLGDGEKPPRDKAERGGRRRRGGPPGEVGRGVRRRGPPHHHGPPPVIAVLDADKDGVISSTEISIAVSALKHLEENGDGELTHDELWPPGGGFGHRDRP
jgi:hypothetical protein